jgi:DNA replication protein DnaC
MGCDPDFRLMASFRERFQAWDAAFVPQLQVPERFARAVPMDIPNSALRIATRTYLREFWEAADKGIAPAFLGRAGQFKTYAAGCIARWVHNQRVAVEWVECGPEFTKLDMLFYDDAGMQRLDTLCTAPLLVLDDFTQVSERSRSAQLLETVAQARFSAQLPTVWTGNMPLNSPEAMKVMANKYGACVTRRILHGANGFQVDVV